VKRKTGAHQRPTDIGRLSQAVFLGSQIKKRSLNIVRSGKTTAWEVGTGYSLCRYKEPCEADFKVKFNSHMLAAHFA